MDAGPRRGAFFHPLMALDVAGLPLGTVWRKNWAREEVKVTLTKAEKDRKKKQIPIEEKESLWWIEGLRAARDVAGTCPQTIKQHCFCKNFWGV